MEHFGPYSFEVKREDKLLFPQDGLSKRDVIDYYTQVADTVLPHLKGRPVTLERFPDGIDGDGFFQKEVPNHFPDWIETVEVPLDGGGTQQQVGIDNRASLAYLANQGVVSLHPGLSRGRTIRTPDRLVMDLDPPGSDFEAVRWAAREVRDLLDTLGLAAFVMTTGSKGGHVVVPLRRGPTFSNTRAFARSVAEELVRRHPHRLTVEVRKDSRGDRVFLDVARNALGQTTVAPYSLRPLPGAPVATPLTWEEWDHQAVRSDSFHLRNIMDLLEDREDPWKGMGRRARSLDGPIKRLEREVGGKAEGEGEPGES